MFSHHLLGVSWLASKSIILSTRDKGSGKTTFTRQLEHESVYRARMPKNYGYLERSIEARTDRLNHVIMRSFLIPVRGYGVYKIYGSR